MIEVLCGLSVLVLVIPLIWIAAYAGAAEAEGDGWWNQEVGDTGWTNGDFICADELFDE